MNFIGVDGCRYGWIAISCEENDFTHAQLFKNISDLWNKHKQATRILIDVPIGLPFSQPRKCDRLARRLLAKRGSSVFPVPAREAVYARDFSSACRINEKILGKKISRQSWNICPKIKEADQLLKSDKRAAAIFREAHPDLNFMSLAAGRPMSFSKKTDEGFRERLHFLQKVCPQSAGFVENVSTNYLKTQVARDDIMDAMVLAWAASFPEENLVSLPNPAEIDQMGLAMEIVFAGYNYD